MNTLDYAVLFGSILAIAVYGILRTRGRRNLHDYLRGKKHSWLSIGLSVMATQASAITFLSTPGQGYADGMSFVQNYFALPLALVIIAAFFLPIFRRLNVYTAYEFLSNRFDKKTRLFAGAIFLIQRGMGAGITIYAPAIVLSTVFGWNLPLTIIASGIVVIVYTVAGGSDAVTHTQKYQITIIFAGMIAAFIILLHKIPCSFTDALTLAGHFGKTKAVDFNFSLKPRYTFWSGMLGGIFLMLAYFGTDQSQVQRYISGDDLRESRLGLIFNALFKIPMQFFILLLGVMLFVFYQFNPSPMYFNQNYVREHTQSSRMLAHDPYRPDWDQSFDRHTEGELIAEAKKDFESEWTSVNQEIRAWSLARQSGDVLKAQKSMKDAEASRANAETLLMNSRLILRAAGEKPPNSDNDYVFITFILDNLPHGLIGLLVASFFAAALSSKAAELNALASCSVIDFYRYLIHRPPTSSSPPSPTARGDSPSPTPPMNNEKSQMNNLQDRHYVLASKSFTILWGVIAIAFALFANISENLIQAGNIVGSLFYGVVLGLFLIGFFIKYISGTPAFIAACISQALVFTFALLNVFKVIDISYLWYNLIGCLACILLAIILQPLFGKTTEPQGFPVTVTGSLP